MSITSCIYCVSDLRRINARLAALAAPDNTTEIEVTRYVELNGGKTTVLAHVGYRPIYPAGDSPAAVAAAFVRSTFGDLPPARRRFRTASGVAYVGIDEGAPTLSAESLAAQIRAGLPLTAQELLADAAFRTLARQCALAGRGYSAELLEYEKKAVVVEAVAMVRSEIDAERAAERREQQRRDRARARQQAKDAPIVAAVTAAYASCNYRTCTQGHAMSVRLCEGIGHPEARSDVIRGEQYSSRCTFRKQESAHTIRVERDWLDAVAGRGLATFEGELVLQAKPGGYTAAAEEVLGLLCVKQGRGTSLEMHFRTVRRQGDGWQALPGKVALYSRQDLARRCSLRASTPIEVVRDALADGLGARR